MMKSAEFWKDVLTAFALVSIVCAVGVFGSAASTFF